MSRCTRSPYAWSVSSWISKRRIVVPTWIFVWCARTASVTGWSSTRVPFVLSRSTTAHASPRSSKRTCIVETASSVSTSSAPCPRPTVTVRSSRMLRPTSGPAITTSSGATFGLRLRATFARKSSASSIRKVPLGPLGLFEMGICAGGV